MFVFHDDISRKAYSYEFRFINDPEKFKPKSQARCDQSIEFVEYVFCRYPVPGFLLNAWRYCSPDDDYLKWFFCVAMGGSLYRQHVHCFMTKKETHLFLNNPDNSVGVYGNMWRAKVLAAGGDEDTWQLFRTESKFRMMMHNPFWNHAVRYLVDNPVPADDFCFIVDYIGAKSEGDPGYSLKGRSIQKLKRQALDWHFSGPDQYSGNNGCSRWNHIDLPEWKWEQTENRLTTIWRISQICTVSGLREESERMDHCVYSYHSLCVRGVSAIFTMSVEYEWCRYEESLLTIEVSIEDRSVVQVRGYVNRFPDRQEYDVIKMWAEEKGLEMDFIPIEDY